VEKKMLRKRLSRSKSVSDVLESNHDDDEKVDADIEREMNEFVLLEELREVDRAAAAASSSGGGIRGWKAKVRDEKARKLIEQFTPPIDASVVLMLFEQNRFKFNKTAKQLFILSSSAALSKSSIEFQDENDQDQSGNLSGSDVDQSDEDEKVDQNDDELLNRRMPVLKSSMFASVQKSQQYLPPLKASMMPEPHSLFHSDSVASSSSSSSSSTAASTQLAEREWPLDRNAIGKVLPITEVLETACAGTMLFHRQISIGDVELEGGGRRVLGAGAGTRVVLGRFRGRSVAVKFVDDLTQEIEFRREVTLLSIVRHQHVLGCLGACVDVNKGMFMVLEYCENGSLFDLLSALSDPSRHQPSALLPIELVVKYALESARGMEHLVRLGILHRDLKSLNLLLTADNQIKVADLGASRDGRADVLMTTHDRVGTYRWSSPESIGSDVYSERSDVYSFGMCLYEMITGALPFGLDPDLKSFEIPRAIVKGRRPRIPPPPSSSSSSEQQLHADLIGLMKSCWHRKPSKRPTFRRIVELLVRLRGNSSANASSSAAVPTVVSTDADLIASARRSFFSRVFRAK
jgi:Protein tyrosine and serine/threonine kinase